MVIKKTRFMSKFLRDSATIYHGDTGMMRDNGTDGYGVAGTLAM